MDSLSVPYLGPSWGLHACLFIIVSRSLVELTCLLFGVRGKERDLRSWMTAGVASEFSRIEPNGFADSFVVWEFGVV